MYHVSLRTAAIKLYDHFGSMRQTAKVLGISIASISRWSRQMPFSKKIPRTSRSSKLTDAIRASVRCFIESKTCLSSIEVVEHIKQTFNISVSRQLAHLVIRRLGYSYKRTRKRGLSHRKTVAMAPFLDAFLTHHENIVAIDECGFDQRPAPTYGYSMTGTPAIVRWRPSSDRRRLNLLMAIHSSGSHHQTIHDKPVKGAMFADFIQSLPYESGTALLLDNASIHKTAAVRKTMATKGYEAVYLPPYTPEFNPIELVFGVIKNRFYRRRYCVSFGDLSDVVDECVAVSSSMTTIMNCFNHVGGLIFDECIKGESCIKGLMHA